VRDVVKFLVADFLQSFALGGQFFVNLDSLFRHDLVSFPGAANQYEIVAPGQALMSVIIKTNSEQHGFALAFLFTHICHQLKLRFAFGKVNARC
jgi:hypothetical protein